MKPYWRRYRGNIARSSPTQGWVDIDDQIKRKGLSVWGILLRHSRQDSSYSFYANCCVYMIRFAPGPVGYWQRRKCSILAGGGADKRRVLWILTEPSTRLIRLHTEGNSTTYWVCVVLSLVWLIPCPVQPHTWLAHVFASVSLSCEQWAARAGNPFDPPWSPQDFYRSKGGLSTFFVRSLRSAQGCTPPSMGDCNQNTSILWVKLMAALWLLPAPGSNSKTVEGPSKP